MAYADEVLADAPVGYWKLNETTGTTATNSGTGGATLNGTYTGTYTLGAASLLASDPTGKSLSLAGAGYVNVPYNALLNFSGSAYSIEAWASFTSTESMVLFSRDNNYRMDAQLGTLRGLAWASAIKIATLAANDNTDNLGAKHCVGIYSNPFYRMYVDGVLQSKIWDNVTTVNNDTTNAFRIGQSSAGASPYSGFIDEVAAYSTALSAARVAAHFTAGGAKVTFLNQQWALLAADQILLSDGTTMGEALAVFQAHVIALAESTTFTLDMVALMRQAVAFAESVTVTPTFSTQQTLAVAFLDEVSISQQITLSRFVQMLLSSISVVNDVLSPTMRAAFDLSDIVTAAIAVRVGDQEMVGWIVNPNIQASIGLENYDFIGFGEHKGRYYGLKPDGLYRLDGDTDNGVPINSFMSLGNRSFGSDRMKRVPKAYIGAASDGTMVLRVIANGEENLYYVRNPTAHMAEQRIDIGRGIRANYWNFEILNQDGCDFDINTITFMPVVLERRI